MRAIVLLFTCLLMAFACNAQQGLSLSSGGAYLQTAAWDEAVNTYNFNRPWATTTLPHLNNGYSAGLSWSTRVTPLWRLGVEARWSHFEAAVDDADGFTLTADLLSGVFAADVFPFQDSEARNWALPRAFFRLGVGYGYTLGRTTNASDDQRGEGAPTTFNGMNFPVQAYLGYDFYLADRLQLSPLLGTTWYPRIGADGMSRALTGNAGEVAEFDAGSAVEFRLRLSWRMAAAEDGYEPY